MDSRQVRLMKVVLLVSSLASLLVFSTAAYMENFRGEWRTHQHEYRKLLIETAGDEAAKASAVAFTIGHKQIYLTELADIDRCTTCHLGMENPQMENAELPLGKHPGDLLLMHPPEKFGCTVCHQGRGRATTREQAHGWRADGSAVPHIGTPQLRDEAVYTSCGRCHAEADLYGGNADLFAGASGQGATASTTESLDASALRRSLPGADELARGKSLVISSGCLGCHKYRGRGGTLGTDLTYVGDKTKHDFDFTRIKGEHTVEQWLHEHFVVPTEVSPGTIMPDMGLADSDARALSLYMMGLHRKSLPAGLRPRPPMHAGGMTEAADGETLYTMFCAACHGSDGFGTTIRRGLWPPDSDIAETDDAPSDIVVQRRDAFDLMVPSLNHADTLAVASDDYLRHVIRHGRSGTNMPAWHASLEGGLSDNEIDRLTGHVRHWQPAGPPTEHISAARGDPRFGRSLYRSRCVGCHGRNGDGGIGVALNSPSFLAVASDEFLRDAIIHGRPNTAMPSWRDLAAVEVSDLLAFIRTWQAEPPNKQAVLDALAAGEPDSRALRMGRTLYRSNCSTCHGSKGQSGVGPSLNTDAFLSLADDEYLYDAIVLGRPGTAMPSWEHLSVEDVVDIINFMRTWNGREKRALDAFRAHGDWDRGRIIFQGSCAGCHGNSAEGGTGPQLNNPVFLASATDAMLRQWISYGKPDTEMRAFLKGQQGVTDLTEAQIEDVISHLRRFEFEQRVVTSRPGMGIVALGAEIYQGACSQCHGANGEGQTGSALANPAFLRAASDGYLQATIVLGRDGTEMKAMGKGGQSNVELSAEDVLNIVAFLRSWEHNSPTDIIPHRYVLGADLTTGRELYTGHCSGCHGTEGRGNWAPQLNNPEFLTAATDGFLQATIARGRAGTAMRSFGIGAGGVAELSGEDIDNIVAYIRTWAPVGFRPTITDTDEDLFAIKARPNTETRSSN